jgi:hypothetical protein
VVSVVPMIHDRPQGRTNRTDVAVFVMSATDDSMRSRGTTMWTPLLGRITIGVFTPASCSVSPAHTPVALMTTRAGRSCSVPSVASAMRAPTTRSPSRAIDTTRAADSIAAPWAAAVRASSRVCLASSTCASW